MTFFTPEVTESTIDSVVDGGGGGAFCFALLD
jgi:hypothetical protein